MNSAELQKLNLKSMSEAVCQISISLQTSRFSSSSSGNGDLPQLLGSSVKDTGTLESSHHGAMHSDRIRSQIFLLPDGPDTRSTASALPGTILCFKTAGRSNHEILTQTRSGAYYYLPQDSITSNLYIYIFMPHFFPYLSLSPVSQTFTSHPKHFNPTTMHPTTSGLAILCLVPLAFAKAIPEPLSARDEVQPVVALVSAYADDNCNSPAINNLWFGFETSSENFCFNVTVAKGVYVKNLSSGCVCTSIPIFYQQHLHIDEIKIKQSMYTPTQIVRA